MAIIDYWKSTHTAIRSNPDQIRTIIDFFKKVDK